MVERPALSPAEAVARQVVRAGHDTPAEAGLRRRVAVEAQYGGVGVAGALGEMDRLARNGVQQVAREADRTLEHTRDGGGQDRSSRGVGLVAGLVAELAREVGGGGGAGAMGDAPGPTPKERRRRRQDR